MPFPPYENCISHKMTALKMIVNEPFLIPMHTLVLIPVVRTISPLWSSKQREMQGFSKSCFKQIRGIANPYALAKALKRFPFFPHRWNNCWGWWRGISKVEFSEHLQINLLKWISVTTFSTPKANLFFIFLAIKEIASEYYTVSTTTLLLHKTLGKIEF